ncbi:putative serine protease K12H4.7 isoform X2 [Rhodnius prolixus]
MNFMSQLADQFLADKYALEHRYYGQSQPFRNTSVESLKYLTVDQSLEDIKNFIEVVNNYTPDVCNKWILFGGSYAGNLAAWARMMYPELIFGAVSSSAPVQVEFNFKKYLEITSKLIEEKDAECKSTIKEGMKMLVYTFNTKAGKEKLATKFKMCDPPKHQFDKYSLTSFIVELFTDAVEFNTKVVNGDRLSLLCIDLKNRKGNSLEKLASLVADHYATGRDCFNYNYNSNQDLFKTEINEYNFERQWYYQKCTELGYFQTTGSSEQPFTHSLPLFYYTKLCKDAFGKNFNENTIKEGVERTVSKYKVNDLIKVTNLLMVYGSSDPWKNLGIQSFETDKSKVIFIEDGWHCQDMIMAVENDSEEVKKSRDEIQNTIEHWCTN